MKKFLIALLLCIPLLVKAQWSDTDKAIGAVALAATVVDYGQTHWVTACKNRINCTEGNPILGHTPTIQKVNGYFIITPVLTYLIADNLSGNNRTAFLSVAAVVEVGVVGHNFHVGTKVSF